MGNEMDKEKIYQILESSNDIDDHLIPSIPPIRKEILSVMQFGGYVYVPWRRQYVHKSRLSEQERKQCYEIADLLK